MPKITPVELRTMEFKKVMRGFDAEQVKTYIEQAANTIEESVLENKRLSERIQEYEKLESIIRDTAIQAQQRLKAEEERAKKESELIIEQSKQEAEKLLDEAKKEREKLTNELATLKTERDRFVVLFKGVLNSLLLMLDEEEFLKPPKEDKKLKQE
ncbi:MAG: DivIVA domain-containing protein [Candidatus Stahlbacteria bacterium]|nr:DivIVA domain-containing protein [Candidatus Stahlbacteria bacterium]